MAIENVIFHIGSPKTGTSIIQSHLAQNRVPLRDKGYFYPITISADPSIYRTFESHHLLTYSWAGLAPYSRFDTEAFWGRVEETADIYKLHTLLLSAENTYWLPRQLVGQEKPEPNIYWAEKKKYIERIHKDLKKFETKIVLYLRRQDRWIESWYNQQIKNGNHLTTNIMEFADHNHYLLDYESMLNAWSSVFGKENIVVRPYEKQQLTGGLLEDFLQVTKIGTSSEFPLISKGRHNAQLTRDAVEFINICNGLPLDPEDKYWLRILVRKITNQFDSQLAYSNQDFLSPDNRKKLLQKYAAMNERIAVDFVGKENGVLFEEPEELSGHVPYSGLSNTYLLQMLLQIILDTRKTEVRIEQKQEGVKLLEEEQIKADRDFWLNNLWNYK